MRPGMQSLLDLLCESPQRGFDDAEWVALLNIAEEENVLPWATERLRLLNGVCVPEQTEQLNEIRRTFQIRTFVWAESLKSALPALARADLPVISFKGPSLAERIYGDAALRTCSDLDLLVRPADLERAEEVLAAIGFIPQGGADDYHRRYLRKATILELHHHLENPYAFPIDMDALWTRSRVSQFQGVPVRLFHPADELLYLCLHAVRHRFDRISIVLDLALAFRQLAQPADDNTPWNDPVFDNILALGWMMAAHFDSELAVPQALRVSPRNSQRLQDLADRLWHERMIRRAEILDWSAQHRFYLEVESPGWSRLMRRWRHACILLTRTIDADIAFAERFGLRRSWQVHLMRPIRLGVKALRPASNAF